MSNQSEVRFPYEQKQINDLGIVFFAKSLVWGYRNVTEPNLFPNAYDMYVKKYDYDKLKEENQRLKENKICKKHVYKTRHHNHEPFNAMCTMICVNCNAVGIPTKDDITI